MERAAVMPMPEGRVRRRPQLRGKSHEVAFYLAASAGLGLLWRARPGCGWSASVYIVTLLALFGVSALYHRISWRRPARRWMRRLDHSTIYFFIAGTATGLGSDLPDRDRALLLTVVWVGAVAGALRVLVWPRAPKWVGVGTYVALGWVTAWFSPEIHRTLGTGALALILAGGILYTAGAAIFAARRPNPWPSVFGYHEVFHACVVLAAACHFAAIWHALA